MKCYTICLNPIKHLLMKQLFTATAVLFCFQAYNQAVGYQGRTIIASIGYVPANNLTQVFSGGNFVDDLFTEKLESLDFSHLLRLQVEAALSDKFSAAVRYNTFPIQVNKTYYDELYDTVNMLQIDAPGYMLSAGMNFYYTPTPAPLGLHAGLYVTHYSFKTELRNSPYESIAIPPEMANYTFDRSGALGISLNIGTQYILRDRFTIDLLFEGGILFDNPERYSTFPQDAFGGDFYFVEDPNIFPQNYILTNARAFFLANPAINVGYLF